MQNELEREAIREWKALPDYNEPSECPKCGSNSGFGVAFSKRRVETLNGVFIDLGRLMWKCNRCEYYTFTKCKEVSQEERLL